MADDETASDSSCSTDVLLSRDDRVPVVMRNYSLSGQCYCNDSRMLGEVELLCGRCMRWFHSSCLKEFKASGKCIPFMVNYFFLCRTCNPSGVESFTQRQANFSQMCVTAIANLTFNYVGQRGKRLAFSREKDIIPYIEANWEKLTSMPRRVKQTWHQTIQKAMAKDSDIFYTTSEVDANGQIEDMYGLIEEDLSRIGPNYDSLTASKSGISRNSGDSAYMGALSSSLAATSLAGSQNGTAAGAGQNGPRTKSAKRKGGDVQNYPAASHKKAKIDNSSTKMSLFGFPIEHPFNKDGYRYYLAEPDPHAPNRQEFDESNDYAGKPIPSYFYRVVRQTDVLLSAHDRAPQLKLSEDRLTLTGEKGYSVIRGTHGVTSGTWYYEMTIVDHPHGTHCRAGWGQTFGCIQAPVGYDEFSYAYRSRKGTRFHSSIGKHYGQAYGQGDVIGFLISLPDSCFELPATSKDAPLVKFKNHFYLEEKDDIQSAKKKAAPLPGSRIEFFKNGQSQGIAFTDVGRGEYFPAISLYKNIKVRVNFGPRLSFPPVGRIFKTMSDRAEEYLIQQCMGDIMFFVENEGTLTLDA